MGSNSKPLLRAGRMLPGLITLCRTAFSISLLCLLVTPVAFAAQQTTLPDYQHPVLSGLVEEPSTDPEATMQASTGIGGFLDQDGRLALPEGFSGSIDPAGFEMVLGEDGAPRFFPQGGPADPDERWDDQFVLSSGCDGVVNAIAQGPDGELYLGGGFLSCEGVAANGVVRFDPATQTFSALGSGGGNGVNSTVLALAVSGSDLYVGGNFTQANAGAPISANRIARWDGTSWSVLGSGGGNGIGGTVRALAMSGSDLYVGGQFTQVNIGAGITANYIARWDGSTWSSLGSGGGNGVSGTVFALAVSGTDLYVGGQFMEVNCMASSPCDGTVAMRIARWNGSTWLVLGSGGGSGVNDSVSALAVSGTDLYVGGQFTQVNCLTTWPCNGTAAIRIAHWNGMAWSALGSGGGNGVNSSVNTLAVSGSDLYVGGWFTQANLGAAITTNHIARWNGSTWSAVGSGGGNGVGGGTFQFVNALTASGSDLYVGGSFTQANIGNAITANRIVRWSGGAWSVPVGGEGNGANDIVEVLAVSGNDLFIGGHFTAVGGTSANRIARWNGSVWSAIGSGMGNGVNNTVNALAVSGSDLYVGGSFTQVNCATSVLSCDGIVANRVARWNGSTWSAIGSGGGNGVGGGSLPWVYALSVSGDDLYVGGNFTQANVGAPIIANHIAHWNGSSWLSLGSGEGNGVSGLVRALAVSGSELYVGGAFFQANVGAPITANRIARWNGSNWSALGSGGGNGVGGTVNALAVSGSELYVGGNFTMANIGAPITANRIARWNGSAWSALGSGGGNGVGGTVNALAVSGNKLYLGGHFTHANIGAPITANRIARWDGSTWSALGTGAQAPVFALALTNSETLYVGGEFLQAGNKPSSRIGRYTTRGTLNVALPGTGTGTVSSDPVGLNCPVECSETFAWDQPIILTATADPGSVFIGWSGGSCSGTELCVIDFDQDTSVTAEFELLTYTIGGTVSGLALDNNVVLRNNDTDDLTVSENESFTFSTALPDGSAYLVTVHTQPTDPNQTCVVANEAGNLAGANVTNVDVTCTTDTYVVTTTATNGIITSTIDPVIEHGQTATVTGEASDNHFFASVSGCNGIPQGNSDQSVIDFSYETGPIVEDCTIEAVFAIRTYPVTATNSGNGSITPSSQTVDHGSSAGFIVTPAANHHVVSVLGDNCTPEDQGGGTWTAINITQACAVTATFAIDSYTVTTMATNGTITSTENPLVDHGQTTTVTGDADDNHYFAVASGCGGTEQTNTDQSVTGFSYETGPITEACTVEAIFAIRTYTVTTTATYGTITSTENPVIDHGQTTTVTGEADDNHYFASVSGCGGMEQSNTDQSVTDFTYETGPITEACSVGAVFATLTYTVSVAEIQGEGTVDVLTPVVDHDDDAEFEVTPDAGWLLASFSGDTCTPADNGDGTWTASNITADCAVTAVFVENTTTGIRVSRHPAIINEAVTYTIIVTGTATAPPDGQVDLVSDMDGSICSLTTADSTSGNTATFTCQHTWNEPGSHVLTANFSGSATHGDSHDELTQQIVSDEFIFWDRLESN